jgi:hypothetical protein
LQRRSTKWERASAPLQRQLSASLQVVQPSTRPVVQWHPMKQPEHWQPSSRSSGRVLTPALAPSTGSCKAACRCKQSSRRIPAVKHRGADTDSAQVRVSNYNPACMQPGVPPTPENAIGAFSTAPPRHPRRRHRRNARLRDPRACLVSAAAPEITPHGYLVPVVELAFAGLIIHAGANYACDFLRTELH